ncbi:MAG: hypothetical protein KDA93_07635 [Planctomycetaceae bacterium]|nr:hypothetical protein [Planctomycetaceae bacterium]
MRSRNWRTRSICQLTFVFIISTNLSGCQLGRTFFHMDSNSPSPFMGFDLLPKPNRTSPTEGVSRFQNEIVTNERSIAVAEEPTEQPTGRLTRLLGRSTPTETLTLPSTDVAETESAPMAAPVEQFR